MKMYKAFVKSELLTKDQKPDLGPFIILTESELDKLIEGETIEKVDQKAATYKLNYSDLKMIIIFD